MITTKPDVTAVCLLPRQWCLASQRRAVPGARALCGLRPLAAKRRLRPGARPRPRPCGPCRPGAPGRLEAEMSRMRAGHKPSRPRAQLTHRCTASGSPSGMPSGMPSLPPWWQPGGRSQMMLPGRPPCCKRRRHRQAGFCVRCFFVELMRVPEAADALEIGSSTRILSRCREPCGCQCLSRRQTCADECTARMLSCTLRLSKHDCCVGTAAPEAHGTMKFHAP
jgi:hypothetical protein